MFHVKHPFVRASRRPKMSLVEQGPHMWKRVFLDQGLPVPLHDDFEDDLVIAAAQRIDVDFVVTFDRLPIHHAPVACLEPSDMTVLLKTLGKEDDAPKVSANS